MADDLDEFDDLDDYLDDFDEEILSQEPGATVIKKEVAVEIDHVDDKDGTETTTPADQTESEKDDLAALDPQFTQQLENFMNMLDPSGNGNTLNSFLGSTSAANGAGETGFQQSVNETINRLKTSSQQVEEDSTKKMDKDEELLTTLLNSLDIDGEGGEGLEGFEELKELLGGNGGSGNSDGDDVDKLTNVVMKMLNRLTSKEMMYDSISSAVQNYNEYFKDNTTTNTSDYERYKAQQRHLENVKKTFDAADYDESNESTRDFIDKQMEEFNKLLPPPPGVIQDNLGELGLDNVQWNDKEVPEDLEGCVQQ